MEPEMMPQGDEQIVEAILQAVQALMEMAGPEWTLEALTALAEEAQGAGQGEEPMPPQGAPPPMETMSSGGPASMGKIAPMKTGLGMN
jgi:hypothetical protein